MFCAISGVTPEEPVVSAKSGLLFEKRLIEKAISETGICPVTGESLSESDLIPVKTSKAVKPRPLQAASIPGMLTLFQNEWDALALRDFSLEQQLHTAREELSHALYQADAAFRVIARLIRERDEARSLLSQSDRYLSLTAAQVNGESEREKERAGEEGAKQLPKRGPEELSLPDKKKAKEGDEREELSGVSAAVIEELTQCNAALSSQRKKRQLPPSLAPPTEIESYTQISSYPLHKTTKPGILSVHIHPEKDLIATGGVDNSVVVFDKSKGTVKSNLTGHTKKITAVKFVAGDSGIVLSGSADKSVRIWRPKSVGSEGGGKEGEGENEREEDEEYECAHVLKDQKGEIRALTVHPTGKYFVSASVDNTWGFYSLEAGKCMSLVSPPPSDSHVPGGFTCASFHPDGLILATGSSDSVVRIWDVKAQSNVAKFEGHVDAITSLSFSENGYYLATAAQDGVKLWDLRKLKNFRTFNPYDNETSTNCVQFDHSGSYLALAGSDVRIYQVGTVKQEWQIVKTFEDISGTGKVTGVQFGKDANYLAVTSMDRNLRIFGKPTVTSAIEENEVDAKDSGSEGAMDGRENGKEVPAGDVVMTE